MEVVIETARLLLRRFTVEDAPHVLALNKDPAVTRYTGDPVGDLLHAREVIETRIIPQYVLYHMGRWAVLLRSSLHFIGWSGLKFRAERNEVDLGYRFLQEAWGKGYATEAAHACLRYGFEKLELPRIVAHTMPENTASARVLEKCGMRYIGRETVDDHPALTYEAINPLIPPFNLSANNPL